MSLRSIVRVIAVILAVLFGLVVCAASIGVLLVGVAAVYSL